MCETYGSYITLELVLELTTSFCRHNLIKYTVKYALSYAIYIFFPSLYFIEIWGISPHSHLRPLLLLQKKIVRIMTFSTYYMLVGYTDPLFKDHNILAIDKLVVHSIGIAMYKINNGLFPSVLNELYKKNNLIRT